MSELSASEKAVRLLGLAAKAGKLVFGTDMVCESLRSKKRILLVVESGDSSDNTHKKITDKCAYYGAKHLRLSADTETLGAALGKMGGIAVVGVIDASFASGIEKLMNE